jgi:hypothetical protein
MKRRLLIASLALVGLLNLPNSSPAQGYFNFNNLAAYDGTPNLHLIYTLPFQVIGSPGYTVGFLWNSNLGLLGMDLSNNSFRNTAGTQVGTTTAGFFGATSDVVGGAGIFDGGTSGLLPGTVDGQHVLVQVVAWYSASGYSTYDAAYAAGTVNAGFGALLDLRLAAGADPVVADLGDMEGFPVVAPEPSTFALIALSVIGFCINRRRKRA